MLRVIGVLAAGLALGGCAGGSATPVGHALPASDLPAGYRDMIIAKVKETFFDPYSIRDAAISAPISGQSLAGPVTTICVRANAKNRMGGYIGARPTSFTFRGGQLTVADTEYAGLTCAQAAYEPFPEIEEGYRPAPVAPAKKR